MKIWLVIATNGRFDSLADWIVAAYADQLAAEARVIKAQRFADSCHIDVKYVAQEFDLRESEPIQ